MNIKKSILLASICLLSSIFLFAKDLPLFTFSLGLTSGHVFYGDKEYDFSYQVPIITENTIENSENTDKSDTKEESESAKDPLSNEDGTQINNPDRPSQPETSDNTETPSESENKPAEKSDGSTPDNSTTDNNTETSSDTKDDSNGNSTEEKTIHFPMNFQNGTEAIFGLTGTACLNLTSFFSLYTDLDCMADLNWLGTDYSHHLDCSVAAGAKLYIVPNIKSISVSIAYLLGTRIDFFRYEGYSLVKNTPFGNGIKVSAEYSFAREGSYKFLPTIGCSWRYVPRGNYQADNIVSAYAQVNFY